MLGSNIVCAEEWVTVTQHHPGLSFQKPRAVGASAHLRVLSTTEHPKPRAPALRPSPFSLRYSYSWKFTLKLACGSEVPKKGKSALLIPFWAHRRLRLLTLCPPMPQHWLISNTTAYQAVQPDPTEHVCCWHCSLPHADHSSHCDAGWGRRQPSQDPGTPPGTEADPLQRTVSLAFRPRQPCDLITLPRLALTGTRPM